MEVSLPCRVTVTPSRGPSTLLLIGNVVACSLRSYSGCEFDPEVPPSYNKGEPRTNLGLSVTATPEASLASGVIKETNIKLGSNPFHRRK